MVNPEGSSRRGKAWVDLFGVIFLLMPWLALLTWTASTYVSYSWRTGEISVQSNGMPAMYVLKSTLLGFVILVGLQGLAWMGRSHPGAGRARTAADRDADRSVWARPRMSPSLVGDILAIALFIIATFGVLCGFPVAFTLAGISLIFAWAGRSAFSTRSSCQPGVPLFRHDANETLVAVPLFIFMGMVLERSGIAEELLARMGQLFGPRRGGLGYSVILVGALLAASTGVVGAPWSRWA